MNKPDQLTRVCTSCGVKKPLAAFLQVSGSQGTTYGAICSDCRRTVMQPKKPTLKESEERSSSSSSLRIGSQQKIASEIEKRRQYKDLKESHQQDAKDRDQATEEKLERAEVKEKAEKDHRKFFIDVKKQGFLSTAKKTTVTTKQSVTVQKTNEIKRRDISEDTNRKVESQITDTRKAEETSEFQANMLAIDLTIPFADPQFSDSRFTLALKNNRWLKNGAPIAKVQIQKSLDQLYNSVVQQQKHFSTKQVQDKKHLQTEKEKTDPVLEQINKSWGPSSKRGR
jgi:hypothetical protein